MSLRVQILCLLFPAGLVILAGCTTNATKPNETGFATAQDALNAYLTAVHTSDRGLLDRTINPRDFEWLEKYGGYDRWAQTTLKCKYTLKDTLKPHPEFLLSAERFSDLETQSVFVFRKCGLMINSPDTMIAISKLNGRWYVNAGVTISINYPGEDEQDGFGRMVEALLRLSTLGSVRQCASQYPELAPQLDAAFEAFVVKNNKYYKADEWKAALERQGETNVFRLNRNECMEFTTKLADNDFDGTVTGLRVDEENNKKAAAIFAAIGGKRSGIGIFLEEHILEQAVVSRVRSGSPAEKAGLIKGDVIVGVDQIRVGRASELLPLILPLAPDTKITLRVLRNGKPLAIPVTVEAMNQ